MRSTNNNRGFTLVELMVAMVITIIGLLGLLRVVGLATEHNVKNTLRNEAVALGEQQVALITARPFQQISTNQQTVVVPSSMRGAQRSYTVTWKADSVNFAGTGSSVSATKDIGVNIAWSFKNMSTSHEVHTIRACGQPQDTCP